MRISFAEPVSPKYVHINPETNLIHLMVPIVGGQEISTDNTCRATVVLREFFDGGALRELTAYKDALVFDIALLDSGNPHRVGKKARLAHIEAYIEAVSAMRYSYSDAMKALMAKPSNLYGIQLRARAQDSQSRVVNPAFTIERKNDSGGNPLSPLYRAMHNAFPTTVIAAPDPQARLIIAVLAALPASPAFTDIQRVLGEQCQALFDLTIDFTQCSDSTTANKATIDALMYFDADATPQDYIKALLGACAPAMWDDIPTPPFYSIPQATRAEDRTERLSILTQFFLAHLTIYCRAKGLSTQNFGAVLDASPALSTDLVRDVSKALSAGDDVEERLYSYCNKHWSEFGLSRILNTDDLVAIKQKFERTYRAVKNSHHMDDFMILDTEASGATAKFVSHQSGAICINFAEIVEPALPNQEYFATIRNDFAMHPTKIRNQNECIAGAVDLEPEALLARISDEQYDTLPVPIQMECMKSPAFQYRSFLPDVAKGKQIEADTLLNNSPEVKQQLLKSTRTFTDYSGRTFNCTAYEYAYWAKDTHMCRMLERHMDEDTKATMLERCRAMETNGLTYTQRNEVKNSKHFDFTPLKTALQELIVCCRHDIVAMEVAWKKVGLAQRDVPVHVINEYCRPDRSFEPLPAFNEEKLPRVLTYFDYRTHRDECFFPLGDAASSGLDFALRRAGGLQAVGASMDSLKDLLWIGALIDFQAVSFLDYVRSSDLRQSLENLKPIEPGCRLGKWF